MKYERVKYPDGQISAKVVNFDGPAQIRERIISYEDLIYVKSICDVLEYKGYKDRTLFIACLLGQRSDRRFNIIQSFDLKIIADIINSCNFSQVSILDPHSDMSLGLIDNSHKVAPTLYIKEVVGKLKLLGIDKPMLISPDAGAYKKVFECASYLELETSAAVKYRDAAGKIDLKFTGDVKYRDCLIVDDICDGGRTFIELGKQLLDRGARTVRLYVTHGYFSKGFDELKEVIDHIYCTNSVKDITDEFITQFEVI
jgi:ribose-phosphate pyrophosphokinase